jgi:hypothetical protein
MSGKTKALDNAELELIQKVQMYFPRGLLSAEELAQWNGCSKESIATSIAEMLKRGSRPPAGRYLMTVKIGFFESNLDFCNDFQFEKIGLENNVGRMLQYVDLSKENFELDLYELSGEDVGFRDVFHQDKFFKLALHLGFNICPAEVILPACIQCDDWTLRIIAMKRLPGADGRPMMFTLKGNRHIGTARSDGIHVFRRDDEMWVFVWPRYK